MLTVLKQPEFPLVRRPAQDSIAAIEIGTLRPEFHSAIKRPSMGTF